MKPPRPHRSLARRTCHLTSDKFPIAALALALLLAPAAAAAGEAEAKPCAACRAAAPADSCCREVAPASFSKESLYQLDGKFTDDSGRPFALGDLRGRAVVLDMFFASCGYACPLTVTDLLALEGRLPANARGKAAFVLVSFDTKRDTPAALARYRAERGLGTRWILLHGDPDAVRELAALLGVKYRREADGSFSHSNVITILNAEGEIVHQRTGLQGGLDEAAQALGKLTQ